MTDHYAEAERLLGQDYTNTDILLRAICHALLANARPPLAVDAYNPEGCA